MVLNYGQVFWLRLLGYEFPLQYQNLWQKTTLKRFEQHELSSECEG